MQQVCFCGAATCQGFIGWRKTSSEEEAEAAGNSNGNGNGKASAQKRKRAAAAAVFRESDCYMCQDDGGELLICDGSLRAGVPCAKVLCRLCTHCESIVHWDCALVSSQIFGSRTCHTCSLRFLL